MVERGPLRIVVTTAVWLSGSSNDMSAVSPMSSWSLSSLKNTRPGAQFYGKQYVDGELKCESEGV